MRQTQYTYLLTSATEGRRRIFQRPEYAQILCDAIVHYREHYALHAFVVMPDHFHALISPDDISLERCAQFIKGASAHRIGRGPIWQRGFNEQRVRDADGYRAYVVYIHENPARKALIDWPRVSSRMEIPLDPMPPNLRG
jgi:putative transposase